MNESDRPRSGLQDFTDRSRKCLDLARQAAKEMGQTYVGSEHILIGLCREGAGVAAHALKGLGITPEAIVVETRRLLGVDPPGGLPTRMAVVNPDGTPGGWFVWWGGRWVHEREG